MCPCQYFNQRQSGCGCGGCGCGCGCAAAANSGTYYCVPWPIRCCETDAKVVITSPEEGATVSPTPVITGTAAPGATVIALGDGVVATATADEEGDFTMTPTLPVGENVLTFYQFAVNCPIGPVMQLTLNVVEIEV